ncbi:MAG: hypothetical protein ACREL1_00555 [bacterium]
MGSGGWLLLFLMGLAFAAALRWGKILGGAKGNAQKPREPATPLILEPAASERVDALTQPWQKELTAQLEAEGYLLLGDFAYASTEFFWAKTFLMPDRKSALLLVNWKEGGKYGAPVTTNVEIYSIAIKEGREDFCVTACAQDGSARLLTGANRPGPERMSLHLKMIFNAVGVRPLIAEHQARLEAWQREGAEIKSLEADSALAGLARIFSGGV